MIKKQFNSSFFSFYNNKCILENNTCKFFVKFNVDVTLIKSKLVYEKILLYKEDKWVQNSIVALQKYRGLESLKTRIYITGSNRNYNVFSFSERKKVIK